MQDLLRTSGWNGKCQAFSTDPDCFKREDLMAAAGHLADEMDDAQVTCPPRPLINCRITGQLAGVRYTIEMSKHSPNKPKLLNLFYLHQPV